MSQQCVAISGCSAGIPLYHKASRGQEPPLTASQKRFEKELKHVLVWKWTMRAPICFLARFLHRRRRFYTVQYDGACRRDEECIGFRPPTAFVPYFGHVSFSEKRLSKRSAKRLHGKFLSLTVCDYTLR